MHGQIDVRQPGGIDSKKFRRGDAGDSEQTPVDQDGLADGFGDLSESPLGVSETGGYYWRGTHTIVAGIDQASGGGRNAQTTEESTRDVLACAEFGLAADLEVE